MERSTIRKQREIKWLCRCEEERLRLGLSLTGVARRIGISRSTYHELEQGGNSRLETVALVCQFYNKGINELWPYLLSKPDDHAPFRIL